MTETSNDAEAVLVPSAGAIVFHDIHPVQSRRLVLSVSQRWPMDEDGSCTKRVVLSCQHHQ